MSAVLAAPPACLWVPPGRAGSYVDDVGEVAERIGRTLLPEQRTAIDGLTAYDARGRFLSIEAGVEMPRQNGKTGGILLPIILWSALTDPDHFVWTAHLLDTSNKAFLDLAKPDEGLIDRCDWLRRRVKAPSYENGAEGVSFVNGAQIDFRARSERRGRGLSGSTVVADEALFLTDAQAGAMLPMLATRSLRGNARAYYGSSAAKAESGYLRSLRRRALAQDPTLTWVGWWVRGSWAEPGCGIDGCGHAVGTPGCRLDDETLWAEANPMLGRLVSLDFLRTMRQTLPPLEFGREFYGWEESAGAGDDCPISAEAWAACGDPDGLVTGDPVLALDVAPDRRSACVALAGPAGTAVQVEVVAHRPGESWVLPELRRAREAGMSTLAMDGKSQASAFRADLEAMGFTVVTLGPGDMIEACIGLQRDVAAGDRVRHLGDPVLARALAVATTRPVGDGGGWAWARRRSDGDITPLVAVTAARWLLVERGDMDPLDNIW